MSVAVNRKGALSLAARGSYKNVSFPALGDVSVIMLIVSGGRSGDAA